MHQNSKFLLAYSITPLLLLNVTFTAAAQPSPVRVVVNSPQDGPIQADDQLTLREGIALTNGSLALEQLSEPEKAQVSPSEATRIEFNLPTENTTIQLVEELPALSTTGVILDGTTQPGYVAERSVISELALPAPIVQITPAPGKAIIRGLTIAADNVTVRGLSLYGFTPDDRLPTSTPPADIFIAHRFAPPDTRKHPTPANFSPFYKDDLPPQNVVIENNWLGFAPGQEPGIGSQALGDTRSAFGVYVFNGVNTTIRRNWIANHTASAVITSVNATGLQVTENVMTANGLAGMPDAIRLEGEVNQTQVTGNLICGNDGSGIYLFKPAGAVQIRNNLITANGRRLRRAAVYLMGSNHQVTGNQIGYQAGPGVVVAAYPRSMQNTIRANQFTALEGLSIDLVTDNKTGVEDYQRGDGPNPPRNSPNRHSDTGNAAVNTPRFISPEFVALAQATAATSETPLLQSSPTQTDSVEVFGTADPGTEIEVYRVLGAGDHSPLSQPIATTTTDTNGKFKLTLTNLRVGDRISAIATDDNYGTSEPARTALIRSLDATQAESPTPVAPTSIPRCVTPVAQQPTPEPIPTEPIRLQVPRVIHFALDQATISSETAQILDRIAQVLLENPAILVELVGHTDPRASDTYNLNLGMRRATAARNYLLRKGILPERMTIRSSGERQRTSVGNSRLDYARDRRVEFLYRDARNIEVIVQEEDLQLEP